MKPIFYILQSPDRAYDRAIFALLALFLATMSFPAQTRPRTLSPPQAQIHSWRTTDVTIGGCDEICRDLFFCQTFDYDLKTYACTIVFTPTNPEYLKLRQSCPHVSPQNLEISHQNDKWNIKCPR